MPTYPYTSVVEIQQAAMSERTQIENELELLELEERQLLIERKRVELKQRLKAITTQNPVDLTIDVISCEVKQRHEQHAEEGTYFLESCVRQLLILETANGAAAAVVKQNKKGEAKSAIVEPVVAAAPTHDSAQKQTSKHHEVPPLLTAVTDNNPGVSTLTEASWDTASSGTVGPHDTTSPAVQQAVTETFSQTRDILDTSSPPARTTTSLPVSVRPTLGKRLRAEAVKQTRSDSSSSEEEDCTQSWSPPGKRARTNQRHVYHPATKSFRPV